MSRSRFVRRWWRAFAFALLLISLSAANCAAQAVKESPAEAQTMFSDAANFQNAKEYVLAVAEWRAFLKKYPEDPLVGKARYYLGVCLLQQEKYGEAATTFEQAVKEHPKLEMMEDARLNLGWCQYQLGKAGDAGAYVKAALSFGELLQAFPQGKYSDQACFFQGEALYQQGKKQEALPCYQRVVDDYKQSSLRCDALYAMGVTHEELKQYPEAGKSYDLFLVDCADSPLATEVRMRKAETVLQAGNLAEAERMFAEVVAVEKFDKADHALFRQAFCASKQEKYAEAGQLYGRLATEFPKSANAAEAVISAGRCFYRANSKELASQWLQQSVDANNPYSVEAAHWLSRMLLADGAADKVVVLVDKLLPQAMEGEYLVRLKMDQADALHSLAEWKKESVEKYLKIVADHPQDELAPQALYNAAFGQMELAQHEEALKLAAAFQEKFPEHLLTPDVKYVAAESRLQLKQQAEAEAALRELITAYPKHADLQLWNLRLGLTLFLQKKYEEVVALLEPQAESLQPAPARAEGLLLIGMSQFQLGNDEQALTALQASRAASSQWKQADETLLYLARTLDRVGKTKEAIEALQGFPQEFPQSPHLDHALYRLAEFTYAQNAFAAAIGLYDELVSKAPDSIYVPYAIYGKGWALLKTGKPEESTQAFGDLMTRFPEHQLVADAFFARALDQRQQSKFAEAIADLNEFLKRKPDSSQKSDALYELGLAQVGLKKFEDAAKTFQSLLQAAPQYPHRDKVLYELAWAYKSHDQADKALETFVSLTKDHADSSFAAEAFFHVGEADYAAKRFADAARAYTQARQRSKRDELSEKAVYKLGWSEFRSEHFPEALKAFEDQIASFPKGPLHADGLFMKAECLFKLKKYAEAVAVFDAVRQGSVSSPQIEVLVLLHGGQSAARTEAWDAALDYLAGIPEKFPDTPLLAEAYYELGWTKQNLKQFEEAFQDYSQAATKSRTETGARARFMMGELLFSEKKFDEAILQFKRCMFGFGNEQALAEVKNWQAKSGFEAARCAEVQIMEAQGAERTKLIESARTSYQYVLDRHPNHELAAQAKQRLSELAKL